MIKLFNIIKKLFTNNKVQKKSIPIQNLTLTEYLAQNISDYSEEYGDIRIIEPYTLEKCIMRYKDGYLTDESKKIWAAFLEHYKGYYVIKSKVETFAESPKVVNYTIEIVKDPRDSYNSYEFIGSMV